MWLKFRIHNDASKYVSTFSFCIPLSKLSVMSWNVSGVFFRLNGIRETRLPMFSMKFCLFDIFLFHFYLVDVLARSSLVKYWHLLNLSRTSVIFGREYLSSMVFSFNLRRFMTFRYFCFHDRYFCFHDIFASIWCPLCPWQASACLGLSFTDTS